MYKCPECEGEINQASEICPRCGADLVALAAAAAAAEPANPRSLPRLLLIWGAVVGIIALGLYAFVWFVLPEHSGTQPPKRSEAVAVENLRKVQTSLEMYAQAGNGGYPELLEALGGVARISAQGALEAGYTVNYTSGPPGADGAIRTYTLTARPTRYGLRSYYADQSGIVHFTQENRAATAQDPVL